MKKKTQSQINEGRYLIFFDAAGFVAKVSVYGKLITPHSRFEYSSIDESLMRAREWLYFLATCVFSSEEPA
jgi:hypothetical protein